MNFQVTSAVELYMPKESLPRILWTRDWQNPSLSRISSVLWTGIAGYNGSRECTRERVPLGNCYRIHIYTLADRCHSKLSELYILIRRLNERATLRLESLRVREDQEKPHHQTPSSARSKKMHKLFILPVSTSLGIYVLLPRVLRLHHRQTLKFRHPSTCLSLSLRGESLSSWASLSLIPSRQIPYTRAKISL